MSGNNPKNAEPFFLRRSFRLIFAFVSLFLGAYLIYRGVDKIEKAAEIRHWPNVSGTVLRSNVLGVRAFHPNVVFEYYVEGVRHIDSTNFDPASFGGRNAKRNTAEVIVKSYPAGREITVYYDPANPNRTTLRPYAGWSAYGILSFGVTLVFIGIILGYFSLRKRTQQTSKPSVAASA